MPMVYCLEHVGVLVVRSLQIHGARMTQWFGVAMRMMLGSLVVLLCIFPCASGHAGGRPLDKCARPSDCRSRICLRSGQKSYCAGSCDTGGCPSGMYCDSEMFA